MTCDVIVVSYCSSTQLAGCLQAIGERESGRVFVVDNASTDDSVAVVRASFPNITILESPKNVGYGAAINRALDQSNADCVLCMNPDVRLAAGAIGALVECLDSHPDAIAVAPKMRYPDGAFHPICRRFPSIWRNFCHVSGLAARMSEESASRHWLSESQHDREQNVDMVSGACVLFRRDYLDRIGRFDKNIFLYEEESDVFLPTRGTTERAYYCPSAEATHEHGASSEDTSDNVLSLHRLRSKYYVFRKHFGAGAARLVYLTDRCVFGASVLRHRFNAITRNQFELAASAYAQIQQIRF